MDECSLGELFLFPSFFSFLPLLPSFFVFTGFLMCHVDLHTPHTSSLARLLIGGLEEGRTIESGDLLDNGLCFYFIFLSAGIVIIPTLLSFWTFGLSVSVLTRGGGGKRGNCQPSLLVTYQIMEDACLFSKMSETILILESESYVRRAHLLIEILVNWISEPVRAMFHDLSCFSHTNSAAY